MEPEEVRVGAGVRVRETRSLDNTLRGFEEMNGALKERAETLPEDTDPRTSETLHG